MQLGTLRKLEDQGINKYGKTKAEKYQTLLKDIIELNSEVINKSSDTPNLMDHLSQLRKNVGFLRDNEKELSNDKEKTPSETYIGALMKLLNKSMNDEDLCDSIIKTLIALANKKPGICNLLVKSGCPRMLVQLKDKTQNRQLANDAMELLKLITLSSKENAEIIGNQNILMKLFQIRSNFASVESITRNTDAIANELLKLPGQEKLAEGIIKEAIKDFHNNVQKDFRNEDVKNKILNNEEIINSFTSNKKAIQPILDKEFIKDLNKACDLASKDPEISATIDRLLANDMGILKKIKDNLPSKADPRHKDVATDILKILLEKSNYEEPLLAACKCLSDYVKDDVLYNKHLSDKIDSNFVDKLFDIQENYLDNPEVVKEINNLLCYLALRNPKLAEAIIKKGGLINIIEELKGVANLNDPASKLLKLNGLKMLNSLLNNPRNLDKFLDAGGVDLINRIVKNEVDNSPKREGELDSPDDKYLTKGTICTKTPEQLKEEAKLGINSFANLGLSKEEADKRREQILNDLSDEKSKDSTSSSDENADDSDNYFVQCLKIINKGLDNGKKEFVDDKTIQVLTNLATVNFPDKFLFNEIATILANKDVKINPDAIEDLKDLLKLGLSSKAQFYGDNKVKEKVRAIEQKIADTLMNDFRYKSGIRNAIRAQGLGEKPVPGKLSDDRWGDMPRRADEDRPLPGKLSDDRWGDMGRRRPDDDGRGLPGKLKNPFDGSGNRDNDDRRPIPGKLKNRFGVEPKQDGGINRYGGKRGKKDEPVIEGNKEKKRKGIELFDNYGNKLKGTYKPVHDSERFELYDKDGNRLDGFYKRADAPVNAYDKNGKKLDGTYKQIVADSPPQELMDKKGNKLRGPYKKLINPIEGTDAFDKFGNKLEGVYADIMPNLPTQEVYDRNGQKLGGIYKKDEPDEKTELYDKNGNKLEGKYKKIISNVPHGDIYNISGERFDDVILKKIVSKAKPIYAYDKSGKPLEGDYICILSDIPNEQVYDKSGNKLDGLFRKVDDNTPYAEGYDKNGKKLGGVYRRVEPNAPGEEIYDKNKKKLEGKYKKVVPDVPEGEAYDQNRNKLKGVYVKVNPKALVLGKKLYDKNGKQLDGTYKNLEDETRGEDLYDKNKNKLEGTYKRITGETPKGDIYDKFGNKLGKGYRKLESDIPAEHVYDRKGKRLRDLYGNIIASIPSESYFDQYGNRLDGVFAKDDSELPSVEIFDKKGRKLDGPYIKALVGCAGIEAYDRNGNKLEGNYRKADTDEPVEDLFDEFGNKLDGTYQKDTPNLFGEKLYDQNGNRLDGTYKMIMNDENKDVFDKNRNQLENAYKKLISEAPGTTLFDKNGDKLDGVYINLRSAFPMEEVYDKNRKKLNGIFRKIEGDTPYVEGYDQKGKKLDGVYAKAKGPGVEIFEKDGKKLDGKYEKVKSDLPEGEIFDKLGNKLKGTFKKVAPTLPGDEIYDKRGNKIDGNYRNVENDVPGIELYDEDGCKYDGTFKTIVSDPVPGEVFDIYGNKLDGVYRKLESDLPGVDVFDKNGKKLDEKCVNIIASIPNEQIFDENGNQLKALFRKVEEDTPVDEAYDKLGNKLKGTYKKVEFTEPGIQLYDKAGNRLDGAYQKQELIPQEDLYDKSGKKLDGTYVQLVADSPKEEIYDKNGNKLDANYRKVISDNTPVEELYDKNGNALDGCYMNVMSNLPMQQLFDKNGNVVDGIFRKIEDAPYEIGYDKDGNKLRGVYRRNELNAPGEEIYDKNGNKLGGTYKKVESGVPDEDVFDKFGNLLDGTYVKVDSDSGLRGVELFDRNGIKFDGLYRNAELDTPGEELFDKKGNRLDGTYKKVFSNGPNEDVYDSNGKKLVGRYKKIESDLPGVDVYDRNGKKLDSNYINVVSSMPSDEVCDKSGKKLEGIYRRINPENPAEIGNEKERPLPGKLRDRFEDPGRAKDDSRPLPGKLKNTFDGKGNKGDRDRPIPGKLKDRFGDKGGKGIDNRPIPGKLKKRFEPCDKGPEKNNGGGRKLGKPNVFDKNGKKKAGRYKKTDSKPPSIELFDKNRKKLDGTYKQIVADKPVDVFDKNGKKLDGTFRKVGFEISGVDVYEKNGDKLSDPYLNVVSCIPQTVLYDKNNNKLNGIYKKEGPLDKKEEPGVEPIIAYNQLGNQLDGLYGEDGTEEIKYPVFDKKGNKLKTKIKKLSPDAPLTDVYDKNGNKLDGTFKRDYSDVPANVFDKYGTKVYIKYKKDDPKEFAEELFDKNGKKLDGNYRKIASDKPKEDLRDRNGNVLVDNFKILESPIFSVDLYDKDGNKLDGKYINPLTCIQSTELFDKNKKKVNGIYRKIDPSIPGVDAYDAHGNKLKGTYKKVEEGTPGEEIYDSNGIKYDGIYRNIEKELPGEELFDKNGKKFDGKYIKVVGDPAPKDVFDKDGNKLTGTYRKVLSDIPAEELFDKNGNKLNNEYVNLLSSLPLEEYYDRNGNKVNGFYQKEEPESNDEELFDEDKYKFDGQFQKMLLDEPNKELYDKNGKKLDSHYKKVLSGISGVDGFDKNGNKLDGKYINIVSDIPCEEVFDKNGKKLLGLFRKVEPDSPSAKVNEAYDQYGNKLDGTFKKVDNGTPGDYIYDKNGNKLEGTYRKAEKDAPALELYDKNKKKLDGTYIRVLDGNPIDEIYDQEGNKLDGTYRKVESDLPGINAYDKNKNKLDDCYVNIISSLPMEQIFDKNSNKKHALYKKIEPDMPIEEAFDKLGNRLFGSYKKAADNEPGLEIYDNFGNKYDGTYVPGKLNDDRFGDMPPRHDDNRPLPGKLKNPFDGQGRDDPREQRIPGKLKNPFDGQGKPEERNPVIPGKLKQPFDDKPKDNYKKEYPRKATRRDNRAATIRAAKKATPEEELKNKNKLLTYLSLATEPEAFKNVFSDIQPEIVTFYNSLNSTYEPVIDKILRDKANKINDINNKLGSGKLEKGDNPTILEPFNINSLPEKEKYDEGVVLSLAKLYGYILDQSSLNNPERRIPGKLKDDRWGNMPRAKDDDRPIPGKLKPFGGQGKGDDGRNANIPGKLKPFGGQGKGDDGRNGNIPGKLKPFGGQGKDDEGKNSNMPRRPKKGDYDESKILSGELSIDDPINNNFVNNLQVLAEPMFTPDNYIFVKQFNDQMNTIMTTLGKYPEDHCLDDDKIEVTENYLTYLNTLFNKAVPFLHELHNEIINSPTGQYPEIKKEKEENLDTILSGAEEYYKADEDAEVKADSAKNMFDACLNLLDDLTRDGVVDDNNKQKKKELEDRQQKLWSLLGHNIRNDDNNQLLDPSNTHRVRDLIKKINDSINNKGQNWEKLRFIPCELSKKLDNGDDKIGQDILDFVMNDLEKHGNDDKVKQINMETLANLSKFPGLMKQIMKNGKVWNDLLRQYADPKIINKKRQILSTMFNNATLSNYNVDNMITNNPSGLKSLLNTIINNPVKGSDDVCYDIAKNEIDTLCNVLKDSNNYRALIKGGILNPNDIKKLETLYNDIYPQGAELLRPILTMLKEADKAKREKDEVKEDENKIITLDKRVGEYFENHRSALLGFASLSRPGKLGDDRWGSMPRAEDDDRPIPGKLKPFEGQGKGDDGRNQKIPGKLKPFGGRDNGDTGRNQKVPGKLKPFGGPEGGPVGDDLIKNTSSLKKMSFISEALLLHRDDNAKVKSSLSASENPKAAEDLDQILSLLRKNYNDLKTNKDPELNAVRAENIHKCLNLLKKMTLAPDNHKAILEGGFMNFMERMDGDYKLFDKNGQPDLNNKLLGFNIEGKNVLQSCSNSDDAVPIIAQSPVFSSTINEVKKLYEHPEIIAAHSDVAQLFAYDNVIFSNLCKDQDAFNNIFDKMGLQELLVIGKKTGNAKILDSILGMVQNYAKNTPVEEIPQDILSSTFEIMNKCIGLNDRNAPLMSKVLDLGNVLYKGKLKPKVNTLNLIKSMNDDIDRFNSDRDYLNSCMNALSTLTKDNPENGQVALDCGLLQKLNNQVSNIVKEGPAENEDENNYLQTCYNLSKLYNNLVHNNIANVEKFNKMGITGNTLGMLDSFNDRVEPKTEEEKEREILRSRAPPKEDEVNYLRPPEMIRGIMNNCAGALEQITLPPASNEFLANNTKFGDTMNKTLENENNDEDYLVTALHALSNHLTNNNGRNPKVDMQKTYKLLKELQSNYYTNPEILTEVNKVAGAMVVNLKNDGKGKEYTKKFYDIIPESTQLQDYNPDLVITSLKLMQDALDKKPDLINDVFEETVPNVLNLLKIYKDNPEIQEDGIKLLSLFARNNVFSSAMIEGGLLDVLKETVQNALYSDSFNKDNIIELKSDVFKLLSNLASDPNNCPKIGDELMGGLISELSDKGYNDEGKVIVPLLNTLCQNNHCIPSFVQFNGIEACMKLLNDNDTNIDLISNVLNIFKNIANTGDEYKRILQDKKVPDMINRLIKKVGAYDKKIEFEGRQLLFNVNLAQVQLEDPNSIGVDEIKIIEPIPPEVRNFLTNGKQVKIINDNGDVKEMQLIFSQDLMKVSAKKLKSNLPPKPKYIIDTPTIKKVIGGHGTDAFKKCGGLFRRKIPPKELCFSIVGPTTSEGVKSLNMQCESKKEVDKWIDYIKIVINYFKKTHAIKGAVIIKKC